MCLHMEQNIALIEKSLAAMTSVLGIKCPTVALARLQSTQKIITSNALWYFISIGLLRFKGNGKTAKIKNCHQYELIWMSCVFCYKKVFYTAYSLL